MSTKKLTASLKEISYSGDSIGRELIFTFDAGARQRILERRLRAGTSQSFDETLLETYVREGDLPGVRLDLTIAERDEVTAAAAAFVWQFTPRFDVAEAQPFTFTANVAAAPPSGTPRVATFDFLVEVTLGDITLPAAGLPGLVDRDPRFPVLAFCSDLRLGGDADTDTFDDDDEAAFARLLDTLADTAAPTELVLLGNFLDLWATPDFYTADTGDPQKIAAVQAKVARIVFRHLTVFNRLRAFARRSRRRVTYIPGARDGDLQRPEVQNFLVALTNTPFTFAAAYYHPAFQLAAKHGADIDQENFVAVPVSKPPAQVVAEGFSQQQKIVAASGRRPAVPYDGFAPLEKYKDYLDCLITAEPPEFRLSNKGVEALLQAMDGTPPPPEVGQHGAENLKVVIRSLANTSMYEELRTYGQMAATRFRPVGPADAAAYLAAARSASRQTRCVILGYGSEPALVNFGRASLYANTGSWAQQWRFDPADPCRPTRRAGRPFTIIYRENPLAGSGGRPRRIVVQQYEVPGLALTVMNSYTV